MTHNIIVRQLRGFAFKIYIFDFLIQRLSLPELRNNGCDLLSKFISLTFWCNSSRWLEWAIQVVICFQNLYLWLSDATPAFRRRKLQLLWFAFKIYIFDFLMQRNNNGVPEFRGCDLLSKFISLTFWCNSKDALSEGIRVVICFQNLYLWLSDATRKTHYPKEYGLWFAFKIYIFDFLMQRWQLLQSLR